MKVRYSWRKIYKLSANTGEPDQTHIMTSDLGLHCLPITRLVVSRLNGLTSIVVSEHHFSFQFRLHSCVPPCDKDSSGKADSKARDQSAHPHSLLRTFPVRL